MSHPTATSAALALLAGAAFSQIPGIGPVGPVQRPFTGFQFTEGPAQDAAGDLYFSDVRTSTIHRVDRTNTLATFLPASQGANGIFFSRTGRMIVCQSGAPGRMVEVDVATKAVRVLAGTYNGNPFNGPNDVVVDVHDGIWFTDPDFAGNTQDRHGVYYLDPANQVTRVIDVLVRPNGILLSPREDVLYVAATTPAALMAYPVLAPGQLGPGHQLFPLGASTVDGMSLDTDGNLYLCRPGLRAIEVITPQGVSLGRFAVPEAPSNCAFGGGDMRTLWITARTSLYRASMLSTGHRPMRFVSDRARLPIGGGSAVFGLAATPADAARAYVILAGVSGTAPGVALEGTRVPLQLDSFTALALGLLGTPSFPGHLGLLDAGGAALAGFVLPPVDPSLAGVRIHFAALKLLPIDGAANAVTITLSGPNP